ncbi:MAG: pentapeptide repeat-containing protein, partial [Thermodesulfobacteriota bacterium]
YANLLVAYLDEANLHKANLEGADLAWADLRKAKNITSDQLCEAKTLHGAQLDSELREIVKKECPELLEEPQ